MFTQIKKFTATLAVIVLMATNISVTVAATQTFTDVPTGAWYYQYVEDLVKSNVVDKTDKDGKSLYHPNRNLNRAELVKMVVEETGILSGFTAPGIVTFVDVPKGTWYHNYVEVAYKHNIVSGYKDLSGKLTGKFGPSDNVTRAQAAKILMNAFSVSTTLSPASAFSDVAKADWFHDYVVTAYNQSVVDGYKNSSGQFSGKFGPNDPITRAQIAKMIVGAQNPTLRTVFPTPPTPPTPTDVNVIKTTSLAKTTGYAAGSTNMPLLQIELKAGSVDVGVDNMSFRFYGDDDGDFADAGDPTGDVDASQYISTVYLYEGSSTTPLSAKNLQFVGSGAFKANDPSNYNKAVFNSLPITIPKGQTKSYTVAFDMASPISGAPNYVAADIVPELDISAVEIHAPNAVVVQPGAHLNYSGGSKNMNPYIKITSNTTSAKAGTLTASANTFSTSVMTLPNTTASNPYNIITAGSTQQVAQYTFTAKDEAFDISSLTIINDDTSQADFNDPVHNGAIRSVKIRYPNSSGSLKEASCILTNGKCTFSSLTFHVKKDSTATLDVYVEASPITLSTYSLSGKMFTVGLLDTSGAALPFSPPYNFYATGATLGTIAYLDQVNAVTNTSCNSFYCNVGNYVYRKSKPSFEVTDQASTTMIENALTDLYKFTVTAVGGDVSFSRFVFKVTTKGLTTGGNVKVYNWELGKNGSYANTGAYIWAHKAGGGATSNAINITTSGTAAFGGALELCDPTTVGGVDDGVYYVVATFNNEQVVTQGSSVAFALNAAIVGATTTGDSIEITLMEDINSVNDIDLNYNNNNAGRNTGYVMGNGSTTSATYKDGLFPGGTSGGADPKNQYFTDKKQAWMADRNIIWSDNSGGTNAGAGGGSASQLSHVQPTIVGSTITDAGTATSYTGTLDWTNCYRLNFKDLKPYKVIK